MESRFRHIAVVAAFFASAVPASAQLARTPVKGGLYESYDVRLTTGEDAAKAEAYAAARATYRARAGTGRTAAGRKTTASPTQANARASLLAAVPALHTESNGFGTATEIVGTETAAQFLTAPSMASHETILRDFMSRYAGVYGLSEAEVGALVKNADYTNPDGNLSWVRLEQRINDLPVFQGEIQACFTREGALVRTTGNLATGLDAASLPAVAALTPAQAVAAASATIGHPVNSARVTTLSTEQGNRVAFLAGGPYVRTTRTELIYFQLEPGVTTLAYSMVLWENINAYYILVDANDGTLLWRKNITDDQTQAATYTVYTGVSPTPLTPSKVLPGLGTQPAEVTRTTVTLIADDLNASPLGWITDGGNATIGNNVTCGLDLSAPNGVDANVTGTNRVFTFDYNPAPGIAGAAGSTSTSDTNYRNGIVTNLFFWTNRYHDALYNLGFTEAARNFQTTNTFNGTNRGGVANDAISAEAQDYSGTNNSNFSTPADGSPGRMQMYIFNNTTPIRDGSLDADVFLHEMTHGTSGRLHNNGSGLATQQSGGMNEGWSDYFARCLMSRADEDVTGLFPSGGYVTYELSSGFHDNYYYGIREFPYAVKSNVGANGKPHNPLTYGVIDLTQTNGLSNGAYPSSPLIGIYASEVHNIGHFWCNTLLEMRARMIQRLGWAVGNKRAMQIVIDADKLDVASPTIVQGRDTIIAADNADYGGDDVADIRTAFALRGVGAGASTATQSTYFFTIAESFFPSTNATVLSVSDSLGNNNGVADPGEDLVFTVQLTNKLTVPDTNVVVALGNYSVNVGTVAVGTATPNQTMNYHVPATATPGSLLQIPLTVSSASGVASVNIPVRIGTPTVTTELAQDFNSTTTGSLPSGWTATGTWAVNATVIDSGNSVFIADPSTAVDSSLTSPVVALNTNPNQQISFKHKYTLETSGGIGYDGGVLEIAIAGGAFTDIVTAGGSWVQGGYAEQITSSATGNALIGRRAWSGPVTTVQTVIANLPPSAVGQNVQFRWRLGSDNSTSAAGWYVDTIQVYSTTYASAPIDSDGDGIPDGYEIAHGLNPNDPTDGSLDSDGDGVSNLQEYIAGTDPFNATSVLAVTGQSYSPATGMNVSFPSVNGKTYLLEYKANLTDTAWLPVTTGIGTGAALTLNDPGSPGQSKRFYRVRVTGQ